VWQCNTCQESGGGVENWSYGLRASDHRRLHLRFKQLTKPEPHEATDEAVFNVTTALEDSSELLYRYV
jgi:hypothetical protein